MSFSRQIIKSDLLFLIIFILSNISYSQTLNEKINVLLSQMTLEEKILQLHHEEGFNTATNTRLNIEGFVVVVGLMV